MNILKNVRQLITKRKSLEMELESINRMLAPFGEVKTGVGRGGKGGKRGPMSPSAKAKLAAVARARWKKAKALGKSRL